MTRVNISKDATIIHTNHHMPLTTAAYHAARESKIPSVLSVPYTHPNIHQILIENHALAINSADWVHQQSAISQTLEYPYVLGTDVAGKVIETGPGVTRFKPGDRVLGLALAFSSQENSQSALQHHAILREELAAKIPDSLTYERAAVVPLALCTAASGLFQQEYLGLQHPSTVPNPTGRTLLVWGGATSVGSSGIQLAVAAGYEVVATASASYSEHCRRLGAAHVFDYDSPDIAEDLVKALQGKSVAGALDCAGIDCAVETCVHVLARSEGNAIVASVKPLPEELSHGGNAKYIWGDSIKDNSVGKAIFEDFLPGALAAGTFMPTPDPFILGVGLEYMQEAYDVLQKESGSRKVVVKL